MANFNPKSQIRSNSGQFTSKTDPASAFSPNDPPLFSFKVTNPITYLKIWWHKVMSNEGVDFRFRIHPLTAIAIVAIIASGSFGFGFLARSPIAKYLPLSTPSTQTTAPTRDTAFTGVLRFNDTTNRYYLTTQQAEAISLEIPTNVNLSKLIGKRIFAAGSFNKDTGILLVQNATTMEILPAVITPIPTIATPSSSPNTPTSP